MSLHKRLYGFEFELHQTRVNLWLRSEFGAVDLEQI